jgi:hypothetical protein
VIAEGCAQQASEVVAVVRIEEDGPLVDAALRDVQRDTWQFEARSSWHGSPRCEISCHGSAEQRQDLSAGMSAAARLGLGWPRPFFFPFLLFWKALSHASYQ